MKVSVFDVTYAYVLVKLFWTFGIKIEYIEQSVWLLEWNFKKITNNQICL